MKKFIAGLVIGLLLSSSIVFGASRIKSAEYNTNTVIFNGKELVLDKPLISVVGEDSDAVSNYMPVRAVLEAMGYSVGWDGVKSAVVVNGTAVSKSAEAQLSNEKTYAEDSSNTIPDGWIFIRDAGDKYNIPISYDIFTGKVSIGKLDDLPFYEIRSQRIENQTYVNEQDVIDFLENN